MTRVDLRHDLLASLAVFFVAVPLSLGIALASGAPALAGIVSAVIGGLIVGALSRSHTAVSGPAAGLSAVCLWGIGLLGSFQALLAAVFVAGLMQLAFAALRAGNLAKIMPSSVVRGMIAAIGVLLIIKQLPHLFGYDAEAFVSEEGFSVRTLLDTPGLLSPTATIIGLVSIGFLFAWPRLLPKVAKVLPGTVGVVVLGVALDEMIGAISPAAGLTDIHLVHVPHMNGLRSFFNATTFPTLESLTRPETFYVAFVVAAVASLESLLAVGALDRIDPLRRRTPTGRELVAQGLGNVAAGLLGGVPITAVIARSSLNLEAGAKSKRSAIFAGVLVLAAMLLAEPLMNRVPLATLAAILIFVGYQLIDVRTLSDMWRRSRKQSAPFFVTLVAIVMTNLLAGILIGLLFTVLVIITGLARTENFVIERGALMTRIVLGEDVTFFHKAKLEEALESLPDNHTVYIDGSHSLMVHDDVIDTIELFRERSKQRGIEMIVGGIGRISQFTKEHDRRMEEEYARLIANNRAWVAERLREDPNFFKKSSEGQSPNFLFIGCSDSRVPAETITKTEPGNLFVHRNIANVVQTSDVNLLSVLQYSVEVLNVPHIIVCGHYGCGGVRAALSNKSFGLIDNWIAAIKLVVQQHAKELDAIKDPEQYERRVIELHVTEQVRNLFKTNVVQNTLRKFGRPKVHGWVYDLKTGLINDLDINVDAEHALHPVFLLTK